MWKLLACRAPFSVFQRQQRACFGLLVTFWNDGFWFVVPEEVCIALGEKFLWERLCVFGFLTLPVLSGSRIRGTG
jgi:hypothetical protein